MRKRIIPLSTLLVVVAITAGLLLYRDRVTELGNYGYLGAFLISLVSNATIILPVPGFLVLFALGATFNPVLVGLAAATGGTIGELTSYMLGYSGRALVGSNRIYPRVEGWLKRWGAITIFVFAAAPLPLDVIGMAAGILRFPLWKFILPCWFGKSLKYTALALAGAWGWEAALRYLGW